MSEQEESSNLSVADKLGADQIDKIYNNYEQQDKNPIEEIKDRVSKQESSSSGIGIGRIPVESKEEFMELAESKFCDDYGMTLAFLVDFFKAYEGRAEVSQEILDEIQELREEVTDQ